MENNTFGLPQSVYEALVRTARAWTLERYFGDRYKLIDGSRRRFIHIYSTSVNNDARAGLRLLVRLAKNGLLVERERYTKHGMRRFTVSDDKIDILLDDAVKHWQSFGYEIGVLSEKKH